MKTAVILLFIQNYRRFRKKNAIFFKIPWKSKIMPVQWTYFWNLSSKNVHCIVFGKINEKKNSNDGGRFNPGTGYPDTSDISSTIQTFSKLSKGRILTISSVFKPLPEANPWSCWFLLLKFMQIYIRSHVIAHLNLTFRCVQIGANFGGILTYLLEAVLEWQAPTRK